MDKNIGKNISKNLRNKYSQKRLDHAKQSAADALKTALKTAIQKIVEPTGDLTGNRIVDKITKLSKTSPQNNLEKVTNEEENLGLDKEIPKERYISPKEWQKNIHGLKLI